LTGDYLTAEQIAAFHRDGYLIVRSMFGPREIDMISDWTDEIASWEETPGKWMMYFEHSQIDPGRRILSRMENFYPYHSGFAELFDGRKLRGSVAQLMGEEAVLFKEKVNFKLPGGDGFKPHQDIQAGWDTYSSFHISVLVCIDEATIEKGCLELVAGFHDKGLVGEMWEPLSTAAMQGMRFQPVPTRPGDAVFFDSYAPHASGPNLTSQRRRVLYVTYNRA
jgi:hypothetical protein